MLRARSPIFLFSKINGNSHSTAAGVMASPTSRNVDLNALSCAVNKIHFQLPANAAALLLIDAVSYTSVLKHLSAVIFEDFSVPAHSESLLFETINYQIAS